MLVLGVLTAVLSIVCVAIVWFYVSSFSYWKRQNIPFLKPSFPFGNFANNFTGREAFGEVLQGLYNRRTSPVVGLYTFWKPVLLLCDPKIIQQVLITDFSIFVDRGFYVDEKRDPISGHLFSLEGEKWRHLRAKLSPSFTTGKLKAMFSTFMDCSDNLSNHVEELVRRQQAIDVRDVLARYATDIIVSVAFGIEANCIENPNTEFREVGRRFFASTFYNGFRNMSLLLFPDFMKLTRMRFTDDVIETFMYKMVKSNIEYREKNHFVRKDFFQMLLQLKNTGKIGLDDDWDGSFNESKIDNLTLDEIVAQVFLFYIAGFETTSTTMTFCLYELAKNKTLQDEVYEEICESLGQHDGSISYDAVNSMHLLNRCVDETLRLYPAVQMISRVNSEKYRIPGTDFEIEPKTPFFIPIFPLHRDPKYYEDPLEFRPERFEDPNYTKGKPYLPFGDGPRFCIGQRMGLMQVKVGLVSMLKNTSYKLDKSTPLQVKIDPNNIGLGPLEQILLVGSKRL